MSWQFQLAGAWSGEGVRRSKRPPFEAVHLLLAQPYSTPPHPTLLTAAVSVCSTPVHVYQVQEEEGPAEDEEGEDGVPSYQEWLLPAAQFEGTWATLHYER